MSTVRWFASKYERYNWQGISELGSLSAKVWGWNGVGVNHYGPGSAALVNAASKRVSGP
jgi:hypothetical protein